MLYDTTKQTIDRWLPVSLYTWRENKHEYIIKFGLEDGTIVKSHWLLRALDEPDQVRNLLSLDLTGAWINEAREVDERFFKVLRSRIGRFPPVAYGGPTYPFIIMDSNPPDDTNWLYRFFIKDAEATKEIAEFFKQPSGLSPEAENLENLPPGYYEELCIGQDQEYINVYVHGEFGFTREGKPVFPAFADSIHVSKEEYIPSKLLPIIIGMDFGLYPAAVFTQTTPDGAIHVFDELISEEPTDIETFIQSKLRTKYATKYYQNEVMVIGDPAGASRSQVDSRTCFQVLRKTGFRQAYPAYTNNLHDRIQAVNQYLTKFIQGKPAFVLYENCHTLRLAFNGKYCFRRLRVTSERYAEVPDKNIYSHVMDALQYACMGLSPANREPQRRIIQRTITSQQYQGFI